MFFFSNMWNIQVCLTYYTMHIDIMNAVDQSQMTSFQFLIRIEWCRFVTVDTHRNTVFPDLIPNKVTDQFNCINWCLTCRASIGEYR